MEIQVPWPAAGLGLGDDQHAPRVVLVVDDVRQREHRRAWRRCRVAAGRGPVQRGRAIRTRNGEPVSIRSRHIAAFVAVVLLHLVVRRVDAVRQGNRAEAAACREQGVAVGAALLQEQLVEVDQPGVTGVGGEGRPAPGKLTAPP